MKKKNDTYDLLKMREMIVSPKDTYEIYQYGPPLTFTHNNYFLSSYNQIINPTLHYFVDIANIMRAVLDSNDPTYKDAVKIINAVINRSALRMDRFSECVKNHGNRIIEGIQKKRKENAKESAMLSYRPIVPYCGSLVKAEYSDLHRRDYIEMDDLYQVHQIMDQTINDCLCDHIIEIMSMPSKYIITNHTDMIQAIKDYNQLDENVSDVVRWILNYRLAVFMKFKNSDNLKATFNILNDCNKIHNGEKIDIREWMCSFLNKDTE